MDEFVLLLKAFVCKAWIQHKTLQLKDYGEKSVRRKFRMAKIPYGENSVRWKFCTAKNPYGENSYGEKSLRQKIRTAKSPTAKIPTAKNPTANIPATVEITNDCIVHAVKNVDVNGSPGLGGFSLMLVNYYISYSETPLKLIFTNSSRDGWM